MQINRRGFAKLSGFLAMAAALGASALSFGCATFDQIAAWVTVGLSSFQSVVDLLTGAGVINIGLGGAMDIVVAAAKAAIGDIGVAVNAYDVAPAADKATALGKISTALVAAQNAIGQFWNDVSIPDPKLSSTVSGLLGIIASTIAAFQTMVPASNARAFRFPNKRLSFTATKRSPGQFKKDFNKILSDNGYGQHAI